MSKAFGGFLIGFFLATALLFGFVYFQLSPFEEDIRIAIPMAKSAYEASQSSLYATTQQVITQISELANAVKNIPLVGEMATPVSDGVGTLNELLTSYRSIAEKIVPVLEFTLFVVEISVPAIAISIVGIISGVYLIVKKIN